MVDRPLFNALQLNIAYPNLSPAADRVLDSAKRVPRGQGAGGGAQRWER